jgi:serine/threonine protein kinase
MFPFLFRKITFDRSNRLGEGGYGSVFLGKFNGKEVAVKKVELHKVVENEELALKQLDHPNIIKLLHSESDKDFK